MKTIIIENTWLPGMDHGWGNGYVIIPKGHFLHGKHYDDIEVSIHGGLTFSESAIDMEWEETPEGLSDGWIVGFDTAHAWDTMDKWPKEAVQAEADRLSEQLEQLTE